MCKQESIDDCLIDSGGTYFYCIGQISMNVSVRTQNEVQMLPTQFLYCSVKSLFISSGASGVGLITSIESQFNLL